VPVLVLVLALCLALPGATRAGSYVPPPGDVLPTWSPDGGRIAFLTGRLPAALAITDAERFGPVHVYDDIPGPGVYPSVTAVALSPDWQWAAVTRMVGGLLTLIAVRLDGSEERRLAPTAFGTKPAWSPDSQRIAFRSFDETLAIQALNGSGFVRFAPGGTSLAWSPDGTRIAYAGGTPGSLDIHVVRADGSGDVVVADGPGTQSEPVWSPDAARIAYLSEGETESFLLGVVNADGYGARTYSGLDADAGLYAWAPDGRSIVYARSGRGLFRLDLETGESVRLTTFGSTPAFSPDGRQIAFSGGGECRDRSGIYLAEADARHARRITNDCRIVGTPARDVIRGTVLADVLLGLGGDDRLVARDPGYVGDSLLGGTGDDLLLGGYREDLLEGGADADRLRGGSSGDVLRGGAGHDRIDGQLGRDLVDARDGARDVVSCGTNTGGTRERDEVWADRVDRVAPDCEIVHRR
jgi:Tol biopolymer transport system component